MGSSIIVPTNPTKPYPTVKEVLERARVYLNDAAGPNGLSGDLLSVDQPYTHDLLNSAWECLQDELANAGVETLVKQVVIAGVPAAADSDPAEETFLSWDGFWNGAALLETPNLPYDLIIPSGLKERPAGSGQTFSLMVAAAEIPEANQGAYLRAWEWRDDKLCFRGATSAVDLKLRYVAYLPPLDLNDATLLPIMRCTRAMAYLIASEYARPRGAQAADSLYAMAEAEIKKITVRTARRKASVPYRRRAYGN